jgi:ABC-2 type transport system ATP-binding protein
MSDALWVQDLRKAYTAPAVDGLSLRLPRGQFYALLGPNGAGKTTTLRIVAGLLAPDTGSVAICGIDMTDEPGRAKQHLAYVPDDPPLYAKLDALEYLSFIAALWGMDATRAERRAEELLRLLGLWENAGQRSETYSRGMKQKLALAGALLHEPQLLMLDEPLTGLDAHASRLVKDLLLAQVQSGATVLLTTHILDVAERLAERIGIIARGRLLAEGALDELRSRAGAAQGTLEDVFLALTREASSA